MKLRKLYCDQPSVRPAIEFRDGLNVVLGEIRRPENREKDTHNLGKSLLARLIDFCLLKKIVKNSSPFVENEDLSDCAFFLEIELHDGGYITVRRQGNRASKVSLLRHEQANQDLSKAPSDSWDHWELPFEKGKRLLDGILNLSNIKPWTYRNVIGYSLRTQSDYGEVFKLSRFAAKHKEWKPLLGHILGLNSEPITKSYELSEYLEKAEGERKRLEARVGKSDSLDELRARLEAQESQFKELEASVEAYNFELSDADINRELVEEVDSDIAELNERRYLLTSQLERIKEAKQEQVLVKLATIQKIFEQSKVYFSEQIVKDYNDLEQFSRAISEERLKYLNEEQQELSEELQSTNQRLAGLNQRRAQALEALSDQESFSKFKWLHAHMLQIQSQMEPLRQRVSDAESVVEARKVERELSNQLEQVRDELEKGIARDDDVYKKVRSEFRDIVSRVVDRTALLFHEQNTVKNIEFRARYEGEEGKETHEGEGASYKHLLCMALDLAVVRAHITHAYPHFLYHDGAMDGFDERKKLNLLDVWREKAAEGLQIIVTVIDSEIPSMPSDESFFQPEEIILKLHDDGPEGRLFHIAAW